MNLVPRVLVIEDEAHIARLLQFVLVRNGYEVQVAHNGADGLRFVQKWIPDAVLLDLNLPDMAGAEVLSAIRAHADCHDAAVIILSAHTFDYGQDPSLADRRTVRCAKPVAPSRLLDCLAEFGLAAPNTVEAN